jgi:DNA-binding phage protein
LRQRRITVPLPKGNARRSALREESAVSKLDHMIATRKAESPRFADAFDRAWHEIEATNEFMSAIADILEQRGLSKAELARRIDRNPSAVRKLFLDGANPTLDTALHVLHALGLEMIVTEAVDKSATVDA